MGTDDQRQILISRTACLKSAVEFYTHNTAETFGNDVDAIADSMVSLMNRLEMELLGVSGLELGCYVPKEIKVGNDFDKEQPKRNGTEKHACGTCGSPMTFREGTSKAGKPYKGYFCADRDCKGKPIWLKDRPENMPESGEVPFYNE